MSDKININLDKIESSMSAIMGQMGLGVKIKGGGSNPADQGGGSQTASDKKNKTSDKKTTTGVKAGADPKTKEKDSPKNKKEEKKGEGGRK